MLMCAVLCAVTPGNGGGGGTGKPTRPGDTLTPQPTNGDRSSNGSSRAAAIIGAVVVSLIIIVVAALIILYVVKRRRGAGAPAAPAEPQRQAVDMKQFRTANTEA